MTSQGSEFQLFLYAPIYDDHEGMTLTVLSALARQDLDPWSEAARLSRLPEGAAVEQILGLLDAMPRWTVASLDRTTVASRLSALLPRSEASSASGVRPVKAREEQSPTEFAFDWRFFYLCFCLMLLINWLVAEFRAPPIASAESDMSTGAGDSVAETGSPPN